MIGKSIAVAKINKQIKAGQFNEKTAVESMKFLINRFADRKAGTRKEYSSIEKKWMQEKIKHNFQNILRNYFYSNLVGEKTHLMNMQMKLIKEILKPNSEKIQNKIVNEYIEGLAKRKNISREQAIELLEKIKKETARKWNNLAVIANKIRASIKENDSPANKIIKANTVDAIGNSAHNYNLDLLIRKSK